MDYSNTHIKVNKFTTIAKTSKSSWYFHSVIPNNHYYNYSYIVFLFNIAVSVTTHSVDEEVVDAGPKEKRAADLLVSEVLPSLVPVT